MAKLGKNIMSASQGSIGNLVVYTMHGKDFVRSKPSKYTDRKSEAQLSQRAKMQVVTTFMKPFKELIRISYSAEAVGRAPYHAAKSEIMRNAVEGEYPDFRIDKAAALLSKGPLPLPANMSVKVQDSELFFEWSIDSETEKIHSKDTLVVILYDSKTGNCEYHFTNVRRSEKSYKWNTKKAISNDNLPDVWVAFRMNDESAMSNSMYLNEQ